MLKSKRVAPRLFVRWPRIQCFPVLIFTIAQVFAVCAAAQSSQDAPGSTLKLKLNSTQQQEIREKANEEQHNDLDKHVTDIKLRALSGARSRFSSSFFLRYDGPAVNDLNASSRPLTGGNRLARPVSITGSVGLRYRFNMNDSIFVATGLNRVDPLHASESDAPTKLSNPLIAFNSTKAIKKWQISSTVLCIVTTLPYQRLINQVGTLGYSLTALNPLGYTRFDAGVSLRAMYSAFETKPVPDRVMQMQNDAAIELMPTVQYRISDKLNVYTTIVALNQSHYRANPGLGSFTPQTQTESLGFGYAFRRDMYFSPSVGFEPTQIALNRTAFNLASRMNF